VKFRRTL